MRRTYALDERRASYEFVWRGDASTSGMGDILLDQHGRPVEFWASEITDSDLQRLGATRGDSAFMGEFELLRVLISLHVWGPRLIGSTVAFAVQAD